MKHLLLSLCMLAAVWGLQAENVFDNQPELFAIPAVTPASGFDGSDPELKAIFYDNVNFDKKPTKVFAWLGIPKTATADKKVPAVILVHGGGGTAFRYWARLWLDRGYAVLAMDTNGGIPENNGDKAADKSIPFDQGGPRLNRVFTNVNLPPAEQWPYHAVAAIVRGNSYLRTLPEIDVDNIGLIGISWGGVLSEIALGVDSRLKFGVIVYGNGFLSESSYFKDNEFKTMPPADIERWTMLWDPANYLGKSNVPILFANGTNDRHFRPDSWQKTYRLIALDRRTLVYRTKMGHAHPPSGDPPEITVFADAITKKIVPLVKIVSQNDTEVYYDGMMPVRRAELNYTVDRGDWTKREWKTMQANINEPKKIVSAPIPAEATAYFFNLYDQRNMLVSSEMVQR